MAVTARRRKPECEDYSARLARIPPSLHASYIVCPTMPSLSAFQFGIFTCPPVKVISALGGGAFAIGGTFAEVIGGAPAPRGVV